MSSQLFYVGTYSQRGSKGIYLVQIDSESGAMKIVSDAPANNASFLCLAPNNRFLFAVSETGERPDGTKGGAVVSFAIHSSRTALIIEQPVGGSATCHVASSPDGRWIVASNYGDGTHTIVPVNEKGVLGSRTELVTNPGTPGPHQQSGHGHSANFSSDGRYVYACDLGMDRVFVYKFDGERGKLSLTSNAILPPGSGPRHFAFHPTLPMAYVINELNSTIVSFNRDQRTGELVFQQTVDTLPADASADRKAGKIKNSCADIHFSADGRTLYGSNRGHDTLAVFAVSGNGEMVPTGHVSTVGKNPRNFAVLPHSPLLLIANQDTDNIIAYRHSGKPGDLPRATGEQLSIPAPVCILPFPAG